MRTVRTISNRLSYANVMATIAVFIALGGTSYAARMFTGANITDGTIRSADIADGRYGVQSRDVKDASIQSRDIANGSMGVQGVDVKDGSLGVDDLSATARASLRGATGPQGVQGIQGPNPTQLLFEGPPDINQRHTIAAVGGYTFKMVCGLNAGTLGGSMVVEGPAGQFQASGVTSTDDGTATPFTSGNTINVGFESPLANKQGVASGTYGRSAGTASVRSGTTLIQVEFHLLIDYRTGPGQCAVFGSAIPTA